MKKGMVAENKIVQTIRPPWVRIQVGLQSVP